MKKLLLVLFVSVLSLISFTTPVQAETLEYPFDEIKIVSAYRFQVLIDAEPNAASFLAGQVVLGDPLFVYVGALEMKLDGLLAMGSSIVIITNNAGVESCPLDYQFYYYLGVDHEILPILVAHPNRSGNRRRQKEFGFCVAKCDR
ncbi:MAG: hypothetical protein MZU97_26095 [Bacillus subtilis]|nr:hypothetical protein [Bacillus subtilis]